MRLQRMLTGLLLAFITITVTVGLFVSLPVINTLAPAFLAPTAFAVALIEVALFFLIRQGYFRASAFTLSGIVSLLPYLLILFDTTTDFVSRTAIGINMVGILLTSILLTRRDTVIMSLLQVVTVIAVTLLTPQLELGWLIFPISTTAVMTALTFLYDTYRAAVEKERRAELESMNFALKRGEAALQAVNLGLEKTVSDRTRDLEAAKNEAERANTVKSAFLASMSHELRTPLNAIINFTRFVAKGAQGPLNEEQTATLNEVIDSSRHLLSLINDVLDMSKIESGSLTLFLEDKVALPVLIENAVKASSALLGDKPIEIRTEIAPDLPTIRGDRQRMLQILLNILSNACKFTEKGLITLRAHAEHGQIIFSVADTGPGIAPEDQKMVFEAFKQTRTGLRQGGGTGLGMPISRSLAEAHGGRLWLESVPGQGSTFYVSVPVSTSNP